MRASFVRSRPALPTPPLPKNPASRAFIFSAVSLASAWAIVLRNAALALERHSLPSLAGGLPNRPRRRPEAPRTMRPEACGTSRAGGGH
eukprot:6204407-Pleurochrysis_carterae.AAC.1